MKIKGRRGITINTDASFNHQIGVGGYAFYIVCDHFKIQKSGRFKVNPESIKNAEMMCIANALFTLAAHPNLPEFDWIVINSDAMYTFPLIKLKSKDEVGKRVAQELRKLRSRTGMPSFVFRHVKAHNGTPDARSWVNDWCDKEAKKWMRYAVKLKERIINQTEKIR